MLFVPAVVLRVKVSVNICVAPAASATVFAEHVTVKSSVFGDTLMSLAADDGHGVLIVPAYPFSDVSVTVDVAVVPFAVEENVMPVAVTENVGVGAAAVTVMLAVPLEPAYAGLLEEFPEYVAVIVFAPVTKFVVDAVAVCVAATPPVTVAVAIVFPATL